MSVELGVRLFFFFGIFIAVALAEFYLPRRSASAARPARWLNNLGVIFLNSVLVRMIFPVVPAGLAVIAQQNGWGVLNNISLPYFAKIVAAVIVLDFIIYLQHVMFHAVPVLWRLHMMHHADLDIDVTTGLRFHPIEILISMIIKFSAVVLIGPPAVAVIIFEVLLNGTSMFNHSNMRLPLNFDRVFRLFVVTPDMHRVHHSVVIRETNSNFGFNLPWWDRLLGTYRAQPAAGHDGITIGLAQFRDVKRLSLPWMLALPFIGDTGSYAIGRWGKEPAKKDT